MTEPRVATAAALDFSTHADGTWRIEFFQLADRFTHRLRWIPCPAPSGSCSAAPEPTLVFAAVEGSASDPWPPSPVVQQVHNCPLADGRTGILGVGMAGRSHWSIAVEAFPDRHLVVLDVACRVQQVPQQVGSRYCLPPGVLVSGDENRRRQIDFGPRRLQLDAAAPSRVEYRADERQVRIVPAPADSAAWPQTVRWKYTLQSV